MDGGQPFAGRVDVGEPVEQRLGPRVAVGVQGVAEPGERTAAGLPVYAECGGLIYLGRSLTGFDGEAHAMAGILPLDFTMDREHLSIAYVTATTVADSPLGPAGTTARGQEFHQSRILASPTAHAEPDLFELTRSDDHKMDALPDTEIMQRWWAHMADIMATDADNVPVQINMKRVFYLP